MTKEKMMSFTEMINMEEETILREKRSKWDMFSLPMLHLKKQQLEMPSSFLLDQKPANAS